MKKLQPQQSTQNIIFDIIKHNSPFKYSKKETYTISHEQNKLKDSRSKHYDPRKLLFGSPNNKINSQRLKKVTFINLIEKSINAINPQKSRQQQKNVRVKLFGQNYKKQKQALEVNKSIRQLKQNVDEFVDKLTYQPINKKTLNFNKIFDENNFLTDHKDSLRNLVGIKNQIDKGKYSNTKLSVYRHQQDLKKAALQRFNIKGSQRQSRILKSSQRSQTCNESSKILSTKQFNGQSSILLQKDEKFFTPVRSHSERLIRTPQSRPITTIYKINKQVNSNKSKTEQKQFKNIQRETSKYIKNPQLNNSHQYSRSSNSSNTIGKNRWRHQNEIEILRHKLLANK